MQKHKLQTHSVSNAPVALDTIIVNCSCLLTLSKVAIQDDSQEYIMDTKLNLA